MELIYTVNLESDEPIMLIDKHIGFDAVDGPGVMGSQFQKELLFLDTLKKKRIQVWINSPGGIVMDGYDICNAIMRTKTKVDTYCYGLVASAASTIFMAGRTRYMVDYGMIMIHEAYEEDSEGNKTVSESTKNMNESIVKMITSRTGQDSEKVREMMKAETWLSATEAKECGMCDVIESSAELNIPRVKKEDGVMAMWKAFQPVLNKAKTFNEKPIIMKNVANKLGLNAEASEEAILGAVNALYVKNQAAEEGVKKMEEEMNSLKAKMAEDEEKYKKMEGDYTTMKASADEAEAKAKAAVESEAKNKAEILVKDAVKVGKISNDAKVIEQWNKQACADFEGTKALIESITLNKKAPLIDATLNKIAEKTDGVPTLDAANPSGYVALMNARKAVEAKNRIK